ncbi:protein kinase C-binding protein NELL1, partial [Biomphalaria pfeifferi]
MSNTTALQRHALITGTFRSEAWPGHLPMLEPRSSMNTSPTLRASKSLAEHRVLW